MRIKWKALYFATHLYPCDETINTKLYIKRLNKGFIAVKRVNVSRKQYAHICLRLNFETKEYNTMH